MNLETYKRIVRMHRLGFSTQIISKKLGVKTKYIDEILDDIEKDIKKNYKLLKMFEDQVNILWLCINRAIDDIDHGHFSVEKFYDSAVEALNKTWIKK